MNRVMTTAQHLFDHHGDGYDRFTRAVLGRLHARVLADAAAVAPKGGTVLDVGTGPGRLAVALAETRPDLTVHAVDISPDMVRVARLRADQAGVAARVHVQRADVADLPLPDASVDVIVSTASFHHWADVPGAARELTRVVRPTGVIWIYDVRFAPWRRLTAALGTPIPRTRSGVLFARAELRSSAGDSRGSDHRA
jgi:ubiquinone/menaquinone biosynthesis C-methylase UbiE